MSLIITLFILFLSHTATAQRYNGVCFYISAHQDDWQLFMGANAYDDINTYDEKNTHSNNGRKVVFIYTTAGNLHDDDDTKSCDCKDARKMGGMRMPYWQVREIGAKNSTHLAASRIGGWGAGVPYPENEVKEINGHKITRYKFKNTVSYFLRIKAGAYNKWNGQADMPAGCVDSATTYANRSDLINTISAIYQEELKNRYAPDSVSFHMPDTDEQVNRNDHSDHLLTGIVAQEAVKALADKTHSLFSIAMHMNYHSETLAENITGVAAQNEAALAAVYCMALLEYNAWPEWGNKYQQWTTRNYFRTMNVGQGRK